jgi:hypothetical protein
MSLRPLLIGPAERAAIQALIAKAEMSPTSYQRVVELTAVREKGIVTTDEFSAYTITIPRGSVASMPASASASRGR